MIPDLRGVVGSINARYGTRFRLGDRLAGGETGAFGLVDADGARFVLKWQAGSDAGERLLPVAETVRRLGLVGYPVPRYLASGHLADGTYVIQETLPGTPLGRVLPELLPRVLALNDLQRGRAVPSEPRWPARIVDDTLRGGDGYCLLEPMQSHSAETSRLLDALQGIVAANAGVAVPTDDVVHFDVNPSNILIADEHISGVVDWEGACAGDRAFDLATLLFYSYEVQPVREALWDRVVSLSGPAALALYLAHVIHRQIDWSIRHHGPADVDRWLQLATSIMAELAPGTGSRAGRWHDRS
jgi:hypothetical protein